VVYVFDDVDKGFVATVLDVVSAVRHCPRSLYRDPRGIFSLQHTGSTPTLRKGEKVGERGMDTTARSDFIDSVVMYIFKASMSEF